LSKGAGGGGVDMVILFDACMPRLEICRTGCENDTECLCRHRLNFRARILNINSYISELGFSDLQIILHLAYILRRNRKLQSLKDSARIVITTRDRGFTRDAWREFSKKRRNSWRKPRLRFNGNRVTTAEGIRIYIHEATSQRQGRKRHSDLPAIIQDLNVLWSRLQVK